MGDEILEEINDLNIDSDSTENTNEVFDKNKFHQGLCILRASLYESY